MKSLQDMQDDVVLWSDETLGDSVSIHSTLTHLVEEAEDLVEDPYNIIAYADVMLLLLNALSHADYNVDDLITAIDTKLTVNKTKSWKKFGNEGFRHE